SLYLHSLHPRDQVCLCFGIDCNPEEQESKAANTEVDETALAVCHEGAEIFSYYALPPMSIRLVKILHQTRSTQYQVRIKGGRGKKVNSCLEITMQLVISHK
ncbi:hypothetical protein PanWU01x14_076410, partial [Parasponia andersonii]